MKILLIAATEKEIKPFISELEQKGKVYHEIDVLVSGVGMVNTIFYLTKQLCEINYDWVINVGIGGSFNKDIALGSIFNVVEERFSEFGADTENGLEPFSENGFFKTGEIIMYNKEKEFFHPAINYLPRVNGITVNTVNGNPEKISKIINLFSPCVESMEGGAVFYVCTKMNTRFVEIRSISNYVEKRNPVLWKIETAIINLNQFLIQTLLND